MTSRIAAWLKSKNITSHTVAVVIVGVAVIPDTAAQRCKESMDIRVVRLTDPWASRELVICLRRLAEEPLHVRELVDMLRA